MYNNEALSLIEKTDPRVWYFVRKHIRKITLTGHPGIDVVNGRLMSGELGGESIESIAGGIVHESWHRELHFRGEKWRGREAERICIEKQNAFEQSLSKIIEHHSNFTGSELVRLLLTKEIS